MNRQDLFDRFLQSLHATVLDDGRWPATSALLDDICGSKGNLLVIGDGDSSTGVDIFTARFCYRGERHVDFEREYFRDYHAIDERIPRLRDLADGRIVHVDELFDEGEKQGSVVYNEALRRSDTTNCLQVRLDGPDRSRIVWTAGDPVDDEDWSASQVETLAGLLPHLRQYVRARQALADARALGASMAQLLEHTGTAVIQLDRRGQVLAANDRAQAILRSGDGLFDEGGFLRAARPDDDKTLQGLVARTLPFPGGPGAGGSMLVSREHALSRLQVVVSPTGGQEPGWSSIGAFVLVNDLASRLKLDPDALGAVLGLTPAQSHVAALLVEGKSAHAIAEETGRSVTTVTWHRRHIFAKLGLSRQADLVRLAMSLADAPGMRC